MAEYRKPISQDEIEQEILRLSTMLEDATDNFAVLAEESAKKDALHKVAWAKSFLGTPTEYKTVKDRESWAEYQNEATLYDARIADALMRAQRERLLSLRESIGALRTLAANVRAQT